MSVDLFGIRTKRCSTEGMPIQYRYLAKEVIPATSKHSKTACQQQSPQEQEYFQDLVEERSEQERAHQYPRIVLLPFGMKGDEKSQIEREAKQGLVWQTLISEDATVQLEANAWHHDLFSPIRV